MLNSDLETNVELKLARDYVLFTNKNIFLTGKAGTGKTTFLHELRKHSPKRIAVVAPTGVAAINAGGVTIHSLFQLPFGPYIPEYLLREKGQFSSPNSIQVKKFNKDKINLIKGLDLLVIDEISMVRADMLDGIDEVLRRYKNHVLPFGGVQLLMIGDLNQLSPVVKDDEWKLLKKYYDSAYFFSSHALKKSKPINIELKHIYRQNDEKFIRLLNMIRDNQMDELSIKELNTRYLPDKVNTLNDSIITLTSHNSTAHQINSEKLNLIELKSYVFKAEITDDFPEYSYPTESQLELKVGAQVMFVKNDSSRDKLYYNGKIGTITNIENDVIFVKDPKASSIIEVGKEEWKNIKYSLDNETKEIKEQVIGSFKQYPLKLAWAITIHKSQGLTFDHVMIDAQSAFAHGQVYVALSRCKTFEGVYLKSPIQLNSIKTDSVIVEYNQYIENNIPKEEDLQESKSNFQMSLVKELFDFSSLIAELNKAIKIVNQNAFIMMPSNADELINLRTYIENKLNGISLKFYKQLDELINENKDIEANKSLQERLIKASVYYCDSIKEIKETLKKIKYETDNKSIKNSINESLVETNKLTFIKLKCFEELKNGFESVKYLKTKSNAEIDFTYEELKPTNKVYVPKSVEHAALYIKIKEWRQNLAFEADVEEFMIMPQKTLLHIVETLPTSMSQLAKVKGIGKKKVQQFGEELLFIIKDYCTEYKIEISEEKPEERKKEKKEKLPKISDTKLISFNLFNEGKSIEDIAIERNFHVSTIFGHLSTFVLKGKLELNRIVDEEKIKLIATCVLQHPDKNLTELKQLLSDDIEYNEIRCIKELLSNNIEIEGVTERN